MTLVCEIGKFDMEIRWISDEEYRASLKNESGLKDENEGKYVAILKKYLENW